MKIESEQFVKYKQMTQGGHQDHRNISTARFNSVSHQKPQNMTVVIRKEEGDSLDLSDQKLKEMIEKANKAILRPPTELRFSVHEKTRQVCVKIINAESHEVIREIPSKKVLDMLEGILELSGLIVDQKL